MRSRAAIISTRRASVHQPNIWRMRSTASASPCRPNRLRAPAAVPASTETPGQKFGAPAVHSRPWVERSWPLPQHSLFLPTAVEPPAAGPPLLSPDGSTPSLSAAKLRKRFSYPGHLRSGIKPLWHFSRVALIVKAFRGFPCIDTSSLRFPNPRILRREEFYRNRKNAAITAATRTSAPMTYLLAEIHDGESTSPPLKTKLGAAFCTKLDAAASGTAGCFWGAVMFGLDCVGCPTSRGFCEKWDSGTAGDETR